MYLACALESIVRGLALGRIDAAARPAAIALAAAAATDSAARAALGVALLSDRDPADVAAELGVSLPPPADPDADDGADDAADDGADEGTDTERVAAAGPLARAATTLGHAMIAASGGPRRYRGLALTAVDTAIIRVHGVAGERRDGLLGATGLHGGQPPRSVATVGARLALGCNAIVDASVHPHSARRDAASANATGAPDSRASDAAPARALPAEIDTDAHRVSAALWPGIDAHSLAILGDTLVLPELLGAITGGADDRQFLANLPADVRWRRVKPLDRMDELAELRVPTPARTRDAALPAYVVGRALGYRRPGIAAQTLLTSLGEPRRFPRHELVAVYHELWRELWQDTWHEIRDVTRAGSSGAPSSDSASPDASADASSGASSGASDPSRALSAQPIATTAEVRPVLPGDTDVEVLTALGALLLAHNLIWAEIAAARASAPDREGSPAPVDLRAAAAVLADHWRRVAEHPDAPLDTAALAERLLACTPAPGGLVVDLRAP